MKTIKIALASAMILFSLNTFAGVCNPCEASGNVNEDSITSAEVSMPHDSKVNELLQKMTIAVKQQVVNNTEAKTKKHKHEKRKARN